MSNINHLSFHLRKLEREEIIRIRAEIMKSRTGNQYRKQQNIKFEKKINKFDEPLPTLPRKKRNHTNY